MLAKAQAFQDSKVKDCETIEEAREQTQAGVARVGWCGSEDCGHRIEDEVGAAVLGEPWRSQETYQGSCIVCGAKTEKCALLARQY
jgi:prolyl-tRNA synthetase